MSSEIKLVSYNIHNGLETETLIKNIQGFAEQGVVVFCLQEFWKWMQPIDLEIKFLENLGPDWQIKYETPPKPLHDYGVCILWKKTDLQIVSFECLALPLLSKTSWWGKLWIRFNGFGPEAFIVQRGALIGTFLWKECRLRITSLHMDWQGGRKHRLAQVKYLKEYLLTHPEVDHEVICGDWNSIGLWKKELEPKAFMELLGHDFKNACKETVITCPPFAVDHVFVKNLEIKNFKVPRLLGSDHFPVYIHLTS